ncbi:MAG: xylulokinase [Planctomycetes bacterium]|nr:xylulokinase [Planctomycetota bacterium]
MARRFDLGLDVGTQGTKALLLDVERGRVVARASSAYGLIEGLPAGAAEQHPDTWARAIAACVRQVFAESGAAPSELAGVGVSGQQHGCVVLDEHGAVLRPAKLWCDTSTAAEARELSQRLGRSVPTGFTASKLLWLARREPDVFARVRRVLLPHEWVNFRLTGRASAEAGDASGTGWFDVHARRYDLRALAAIDPRSSECLPELIASDALAGVLTSDGARWLGLDSSAAGAGVSAGGGDNMLSAIGSGAVEPGPAVLSLGTSATVFAYSSQACVDPQGLIAPFCDSTGGWLPLLCVMNATGVLEEVRAAFGVNFDELTRAAAEAPPGCAGVSFVPFLVGERVPDLPQASGALLGLRPGGLRAGNVFRAALEGVAFNLANGVERLRAMGVRIESLRAVGGGARNELWRRILASVLEAPLEVLAEPEAAALGAALQVNWARRRAAGEALRLAQLVEPWVAREGAPVAPQLEWVQRYRELRPQWSAQIGRLFPPEN